MNKFACCILVLVAASISLFAMTAPPPKPSQPQPPTDAITVFITGYELGALKPCGCSGGQLGGFDRRSAVLNTVPSSKRLLVDTGSFVESDKEQDLIKFNIIVQALDMLNYDVVSLSPEDINLAKDLYLLDSMESVFNVITLPQVTDFQLPAKFTRQYTLNNKATTVTIAAYNTDQPIKQLKNLFPPAFETQTINILISNRCDDTIIDSITRAKIVDCIICPSEYDEPMLLSEADKKPLVISVGRFGRYVAKLQITTPLPMQKPKLQFSYIPVSEDLPHEKPLLDLYKDYQQLVKEANLLEKHPRFVLPDGLKYTGSDSCKTCHTCEYEIWSKKPHAHAYATLERVGSQYDPECIVCHVVGFDYETGFVSEFKSLEDLRNVGCENCHGPGSKHIQTWGVEKTTEPKSTCTDCHTPITSGEYMANEQRYFEEIVHWKEPNAVSNVK